MALTIAVLTVQDAYASCGDWLYHPPEDSQAAEYPVETKDSNSPANHPIRKRCHGPHCRGNQSPAPLPGRAPIEVQRTNDLAVAPADSAEDRGDLIDRLPDDDASAQRGFHRRVERPPRV